MDTTLLNDYKEFTVTETEGFRLRVRKWKCMSPSNLNSIEYIQESLKDGEVIFDSTYNYFMTDEEVTKLCNLLQS